MSAHYRKLGSWLASMRFVQTSIREYFPSVYTPPKPVGPTFFHLPYDIRRRIYIEAGLVRECPVDLNSPKVTSEKCITCVENFGEEHHDVGKYRCPHRIPLHQYNLFNEEEPPWLNWPNGCTCEPLPCQLLFVSRKVYDEVSTILYSENLFIVSINHSNRLKPLQRLGRRELSCLTSLAVRLDTCRCANLYGVFRHAQDYCDFYREHRNCIRRPKHLQCLQTDSRVAPEWRVVARRLAQCLQPGRLHLTLICEKFRDISGLSVLVEVTSRLKLKDCSLRLSVNKEPELSALAQSTSLAATDRATSRSFSSFAFSLLPAELQQNVLFQSDLVIEKAVDWDPCSRVFATYSLSSQEACCGSCAPFKAACCCPNRQSAYSSTCSCVSIPLQKMLVSRRLRDQASCAFYTRNEFNILACRPWWFSPALHSRMPERHAHKQALSSFLSNIQPHAVQQIRRLCFSITSLSRDPLGLLKASLQVSKLHVTLLIDCHSGGDWDDYGRTLPYSPMRATEILRDYAQTVGLLKNLPLKDFWVFINWPVAVVDAKEVRHKRERDLEQIVMGGNYDGYSRGKVDDRESFKRKFHY